MSSRARLAFALAVLGGAFLLAGIALSSRGRGAIDASDAAWASGDARAAIAHARRAASAAVPRSDVVSVAHERLRTIAHALEARGDVEGALLSWRAARASAYAVRSFTEPNVDVVRESDEAIARLVASAGGRAAALTVASAAAARRPASGDASERILFPRAMASLLLLAGALAWLLGAYRSIVLWSVRSPVRGAELRWACGLTMVGALGWAAGLALS